MKIGLQLPHFRPSTGPTMRSWMRETARTVEEGGFDSLWVMDHFFQLGGWLGEPEDEMLEGYTTLGYLAGVTEMIKLGLMVGGVIYRHPSVVIKMINSLDVLSGGRTYFGIGAGWYDHETISLGMRFPSKKERFEQLEDILRLAHHMWEGKTEEFTGTHVTAPYPVSNPQPLQQPHPPILIGGMGPKKTLRFVAQYADGTNFFGAAPDDVIEARLEVLKRHCEDVDRPYDEIEKTVLEEIHLEGDYDAVERARKFAGWGFDHVIFNVRGDYSPETLGYLTGEVVPAVRDL